MHGGNYLFFLSIDYLRVQKERIVVLLPGFDGTRRCQSDEVKRNMGKKADCTKHIKDREKWIVIKSGPVS